PTPLTSCQIQRLWLSRLLLLQEPRQPQPWLIVNGGPYPRLFEVRTLETRSWKHHEIEAVTAIEGHRFRTSAVFRTRGAGRPTSNGLARLRRSPCAAVRTPVPPLGVIPGERRPFSLPTPACA